MLHQAFDVFRVQGFRPHHPFHLFRYGADLGSAPVGAVAYIGDRRFLPEALYRRDHAAVETVVVVGAEDIHVVVLFVLHGEFHLGQTLFEKLRLVHAPLPAAENVAAPAHIHIRQIFFRFPVLGVQHQVDAGTVRAGSVAEDAEGRAAPGVVCGCAACFQGFAVFPDMFQDKVVVVGFI